MSVVEEIEKGMCRQKIAYSTYDEAQEAYWEMCEKRDDTENLTWYKCEFCGYWHLGNERPGMAKRIERVRNERKDHEVVATDRSEGVQ